ncbi:non-repetitive nucleoporin-like protein [Aaosphaeria arxii CBS 175.79]|uniref:Non-repetitive nucleoporin-like protein n=1 Tax=Aaosphaeria arxii CBS 175.79 TaxID=1450172 RepID=A0A6A5XJN9_9PLEO|nr:non-repetitive nucleoporin-like protein [Aaosphaeria arxii CBS 175.79]KAF2013061.1 non-repetitive nucleoporin-like protein [Aaosphaeria arxii CBS 175.79]
MNPPATPQRPGPGVFPITPAPARPELRRAPTAQPTPASTAIERAAKTVNEMLEKDRRYRDLESYVGQGISGDYEPAEHIALTPFQKLRTYEIPERIFEQVNETQINTNMGLFAEINHAWVSVDNQLYLWDYTHPNPELVGYEEQPHLITSVKLVKPRARVFVPTISHLLVVATVETIFLIAVETNRGPEGVLGITLYRTGFSVSVRGTSVSAIAGSAKTGRIFFGDGRDSEDVYELYYQQEEKWFASKCSKTNHVKKSIGFPSLGWYSAAKSPYVVQMEVDDTRNVLYTLSSNGNIRVFHMRTITSLDLAITMPLTRLRTMCSHIIRQSELLDPNMKIAGIDPIAAPEAGQLSLVATTTSGVRIYLSTTTGGYYSDAMAAPNSMQVRHIRLPPADGNPPPQATSSQLQPYQAAAPLGYDSKVLTTTIKAARFAPGSFFCFVAKPSDPNQHFLFASAPHTGKIGNDPSPNVRFTETSQQHPLGGLVQDIGLVSDPFSAAERPIGFGNELAVQFDRKQTEFAIMTHNGIETIRRRRLVDILASIIKSPGGSEGIEGDIRSLLSQYGVRELASAALAVACGQGSDVGPDSRVAKVSDPEVLEFARKVFIEHGGRASLDDNTRPDDLTVDSVRPSPRHDGIAMYVSRLVRSIWQSPIIKEKKIPTGSIFEPVHSIGKLQEIQGALVQLQEFLDTNKQHIDGLSGPEAMGRVTSRKDEIELQGENRALSSLLQLINNIIEGIAFVLVLFDERLEDILVLLPADSRASVLQLTFQGLFSVSQGKVLAKELVKAIVNRNITKGSNVETVAEALRRKCGSFCSSDDVVIFKAQENLKKASDLGANAEQGRILLNDSLRLFEQVGKSLSNEHLTAAVNKFVELQFYAGAIKLALKVAQDSDRGNKALSWIKDGRPAQDVREEVYIKRTECYDLIFRVIEAVDQVANTQPPTQDGVISVIDRRKHEAYEQINNSEDEVFQNYLYDWYLSRGWADRLLEISSSYVVDYLRRSSATNMSHADLLWRYYAHYSDFLSAAEVQFELAKGDFDLSLEKRIEYLSRAKANASTRVTGFSEMGARNRQSRQELLRNISDHLDIANIQDDILQKIKNDPRLQGERRQGVLQLLDSKILTLDELYHQYADQAGYYDISLLIYHAADHRSIPDVRSTWTNLIERVHTQAVENQQQAPWETVSLEVENVGRRVNLNENVFPVNILLQLLLQYDVQNYNHDSTPSRGAAELIPCSNLTWPIDVFIKLDAPFEALVATLESLWYAQEPPFTGPKRKLIVKWIIYTINQWKETSRRQGVPFGAEENALGLADCLRVVLQSDNGLRRDSADDKEWIERGRELKEFVDSCAR